MYIRISQASPSLHYLLFHYKANTAMPAAHTRPNKLVVTEAAAPVAWGDGAALVGAGGAELVGAAEVIFCVWCQVGFACPVGLA